MSITRHGNLGKNCNNQVNAKKDQNLQPQRSDQRYELKNHKIDSILKIFILNSPLNISEFRIPHSELIDLCPLLYALRAPLIALYRLPYSPGPRPSLR